MARNVAPVPELAEKVVYINRVSKVVKGGRRFSLSALVVVGDREGRIGIGMGKSSEVPNAIKKAIDDAKKNMFSVPVINGTLPHETVGQFGAARVVLKPAAPGCGVIAGGPARAVLELAGYTDVLTKSLGSSNPVNVVKATAEGLKSMQFASEVARRRGMTIEELYRIKPAVATKTTEALDPIEGAEVATGNVATLAEDRSVDATDETDWAPLDQVESTVTEVIDEAEEVSVTEESIAVAEAVVDDAQVAPDPAVVVEEA